MELVCKYLRVLKVASGNKGTALRQTRKSLGYSAKYVADVLNISPSTLYKYERDPANLDAKTAIEIARVYGVCIDDLSFS